MSRSCGLDNGNGIIGTTLSDRIALVLGGGAIAPGIGIGRALCLAYAREGAKVIVADRDGDAARDTVEMIYRTGGIAEPAVVDVLDDASILRLVDGVLQSHGKIDILHCNVGLGKSGPSESTSAQDWRRISDANLTSLHVATQAALPAMRARNSGVILITSSISGQRDLGYPHLAYGSTKAAAIHFARLLAVENAPYGIRVNTVVAGLIDTPRIAVTLANSYGGSDETMMRKARDAQCPLGRMGSAWDVAEAAVFLASDKASYITGTELVVDGGLTATVRQPTML